MTLLASAVERSAAELATAAVQNGTDTRTDGHRIVKQTLLHTMYAVSKTAIALYQDEAASEISRSNVILVESYCPDTESQLFYTAMHQNSPRNGVNRSGSDRTNRSKILK